VRCHNSSTAPDLAVYAQRSCSCASCILLVIDWGDAGGGLHVFCAVLAWSRVRFVRFADNERAQTTLAMLAECFETLGGVPKVVLATGWAG
jgi:hypothetical protein